MYINLLEYFFPPKCIFCGTFLNFGVPIYICETCLQEIEYYNNTINSLNLPSDVKTYCDGMICVGKYSGNLRASLKRFKFNNKPSYYRALSKLLALKVENTLELSKIDLIIPVPLHSKKLKQRGYNQAELLASHTAKLLKKPCIKDVLIKSEETKSQSTLNRKDRLYNLENSFNVINSKAIIDKNILIIDDIITTGSTLNNCCKSLKLNGAGKITAGVIATTREL